MSIKNEINVYVGIDPSMNSTGVTIIVDDNAPLFYVIKNKQTKKEAKLLSEIESKKDVNIYNSNKSNLSVLLYDYNDNNFYNKKDENHDPHKCELLKTKNLMSIVNTIESTIDNVIQKARKNSIDIYYSNKSNFSTKNSTSNSTEISLVVNLNVCIETNAYSAGTRSVSLVDLCGLNFLIRAMILNFGDFENSVIIYNSNKSNFSGNFSTNLSTKVNTNLVCSTPQEIKKFATGRGDADKELMLYCFSLVQNEITSKYNFLKLDDVADSFFMAEFVKAITNCNNKNNQKNSVMYYYSNKSNFSANLSAKIEEQKEQKRKAKIDKKNKKNKQTIWDNDMCNFADKL